VELDAATEGPVTLAVLVEGTATGVRDRAARLEKVLGGQATDEFPSWWGRYPWGRVGMKLTVPLSHVPDLLSAGVAVRGSAGTGVLYADVPVEAAPTVVERLRAITVRAGGHAVVLTAPQPVREMVDMWGPVAGLALMRRVKDRFDPGHRFAPGRFVGGI
jgi:glycolate oxidase FAD binding subunit